MPNGENTLKKPTTMILRFRDLATNAGETIDYHKEKIEGGHAWWGWWNKAGERIPEQTFRDLLAQEESNGLSVRLFDSGQSLIYPATIEDIHWHTKFERQGTPEPEHTPDYYEGRELLAWFKLTSIGDPIPADAINDELSSWSYVPINDFFETNRSVFQMFTDKKVSSLEELRHQERTIWFVRPSLASDSSTEILLQTAEWARPSNFPKSVIECNGQTILWLSDLHFSTDHHAFPIKPHEAQGGNNLSEAIRKDLEQIGVRDLAAIFVSGDLTWAAVGDEFEKAASFLKDLQSWSSTDPNNIVVCPGNHDIRFSDTPWEKGQIVPEVPDDAKEPFEDFYRSIYDVSPNRFLASGRRLLLGGSTVVEVASLNSSHLQQTGDVFQGHGFVGQGQRDLVAEEMGWNASGLKAKPLRIVMLHHHVIPVLPQEVAAYDYESSVLYDSGALCNWLVKHRVDLVLHGHMHHTNVIKESRSPSLGLDEVEWHDFTIAALGSTGVDIGHNQLDGKNVYGLLDFHRDHYRLRVREVSPTDSDSPTNGVVVDLEIPRWNR